MSDSSPRLRTPERIRRVVRDAQEAARRGVHLAACPYGAQGAERAAWRYGWFTVGRGGPNPTVTDVYRREILALTGPGHPPCTACGEAVERRTTESLFEWNRRKTCGSVGCLRARAAQAGKKSERVAPDPKAPARERPPCLCGCGRPLPRGNDKFFTTACRTAHCRRDKPPLKAPPPRRGPAEDKAAMAERAARVALLGRMRLAAAHGMTEREMALCGLGPEHVRIVLAAQKGEVRL